MQDAEDSGVIIKLDLKVGNASSRRNITVNTMTSYSCDLCGLQGVRRNGYDFVLERTVLEVPRGNPKYPAMLPRCRIVINTRLSFADHPSGYGGPPDLCDNCFKEALVKTLEYLKDTKQ